MKDGLFDIFRFLIELAWRRRRLILLPLVTVIPFSVVLAYLLPQSFASRALLVLQEQSADTPLARGTQQNDRVRERAPGLEALLRSERVLGSALRDVMGERFPADPRAAAMEIREFGRRLKFEMIGSDFLEFQLQGSRPQGLGRELEAITSRFLENLLSPELSAVSAPQVLLDRRREELRQAQQALSDFKAQLGDRGLAGIAANRARLAELTRREQALAADIIAANDDIVTVAASLDLAGERLDRRAVEAAIRAVDEQLIQLQRRGQTDANGSAAALRQRLVTLRRIEAQLIRKDDLATELSELNAAKARQAQAEADGRTPEGQLIRLERDAALAQQQYDAYVRRFPATTSAFSSLQVLRAPERIRVIDTPKDPEFPLASRLRYIIAGVIAALMLSGGLAVAAEALDQRLRRQGEFEAVAGVPVLARLPAEKRDNGRGRDGDASTPPPAPEPEPPKFRSGGDGNMVVFARRRSSAA